MRSILTAVLVAARLLCQESEPADWREDVKDALRDGRERVALGILSKQIEDAKAPADALELFADVAWNVGDHDRSDAALKRWVDEYPKDPRARLTRARQLWQRGRHDAALEVLAPMLVENEPTDTAPLKWIFPALSLAGQIHQDRGNDAEAEKLYEKLVDESKRVVIRASEDLHALVPAYLHFGGKGLKLAEQVLKDLQEEHRTSVELDVELGEFYLERKYLWVDAQEEFRAALKKRPAYVPALLGMHAAQSAGMKREDAKKALELARGTNPSDPDVLAVLVADELEAFQPDRATEKMERGLRVNPAHKRLLALQAAREMVLSRKAEGDQRLEELLKLDPTYGEALRIVASVLNERRRWPECLEMMKRAVEIDPKNPALWDDYARYALYLGQNALAEGFLKKADDADTYSHPWRKNMWELLYWMGKHYARVDSQHFDVKVFDEDRAILAKVMLPFIERSYSMLTKKYQYVPAGVEGEQSRLLLEVFKNHQTFSVRTMGFNGLGALGVCFGPFIAMDAPNVQGMGVFSWARTFHHELAHTMTIGLSKGRVPRWLTEGLSTFEEIEFDPAWTRGMDRDLFDAFHTDGLLKLAEFDSAFGTPRIIYAYYQGGLEAGYLVKTYGMDKVLEALKLFGQDLPQEEVFKRAFGVPTSEIDEGFRKAIAARIAPMKMQPRYRPDVLEKMDERWKADPKDELLVRLAWARFQNKRTADAEALLAEAEKRKLADPRLKLLEARMAEQLKRADRAKALFDEVAKEGVQDYDLAWDLGRAAEKRGDPEEAMKRYRDAIDWFPTNPGEPNARGTGRTSPRIALAGLLRGGGETEEAIALVEEHLRHSPDDLDARREVIDHKKATGDLAGALVELDKYVLINPFEDTVHGRRSEILLSLGRHEESLAAAELAFDGAKTKPPARQATALVAAARALLKLGRADEARTRVEEALRISRGHGGATALMGELDSRPEPESKPAGGER